MLFYVSDEFNIICKIGITNINTVSVSDPKPLNGITHTRTGKKWVLFTLFY